MSRPRRAASQQTPPIELTSGYPDSLPSNAIEELVSRLDQQAFPVTEYSRVDHILIQILFSTKRRSHRNNALVPMYSLNSLEPPSLPSRDAMIDMATMHSDAMSKPVKEWWDTMRQLANDYIGLVPEVLSSNDSDVLHQ
jgi:hypothetical protein